MQLFSPPAVEGYLQTANSIILDHVSSWNKAGTINVYDAVGDLVADIMTTIWIGKKLPADTYKALHSLFKIVNDGTFSVPISSYQAGFSSWGSAILANEKFLRLFRGECVVSHAGTTSRCP